MASVIKSIAFKNFYNFYGDFENNTFTFSEGLNIINADNGMGKSKMYNGFLWIIKDMVYDSDLREPDGVVHSAIKSHLRKQRIRMRLLTLVYALSLKTIGKSTL